MRIDKEEKRSLKKLFVGILVMALLVTMLPFENMGTVVARASEAELKSDLQNMDIFKGASLVLIEDIKPTENNPDVKEMSAENYFMEQLYYASVSDTPTILVLNQSLNFTNGISRLVYGGTVGIDMRGYDITGLQLVGESSVLDVPVSDTINGNDLIIYGSGVTEEDGSQRNNHFSFIESNEYQEGWYIDQGQQVIFAGAVDLQNVNVTVSCGAAFTYKEVSYDVSETEYRFYNCGEGVFRYDMKESVFYIDQLEADSIVNTEFYLNYQPIGGNLWDYAKKSSTYVYSKEAISVIPSSVTLCYEDKTYPNPNETLVLDMYNGIYSVSDDGKDMTIYAVEDYGWGHYYRVSDDVPALFALTENFFTKLSSGDSVQAENVKFTAGVIEDTYVDSSQREFEVAGVLIYPYDYGETAVEIERNFIDFTFDFSNCNNEMKIFNRSGSAVDLNNSVNAAVYVRDLTHGLEISNVTYNKLENEFEGIDPYYYIKAGSTLEFTPTEGYMIYDIQLGDWRYIEDEADPTASYYSYEMGRRADLDTYPFVFKNDGAVQMTVPSFSANIAMTVEKIGEDLTHACIESNTDYFYKDEVNDIYYYDKFFDMCATDGYAEISCLEDGKRSDWSASAPESEQGEYSKTYYVLDKSTKLDALDEDHDGSTADYMPSSTYGKITCANYDFVIDTESPVITEVIATGKDGKVIDLQGKWNKPDTPIADTKTVWTAQPSVTITADISVTEGTPFAGFNFGEGWQESGVYTYSGDGVYSIKVRARDEFDVATDRVTGIWGATLGIDTTAPTLVFTDAKNQIQSTLKSNGVYEGNLYVVCGDGNGSGIAKIELYKQNGSDWVICKDALTETEEGFYIAPSAEDVVYKISVVDNVGNKTDCENLTVKAYVQDLAVDIGNATGNYGEDIEIPVTIANASENTLIISSYALREDGTNSVFDENVTMCTELKAGEIFETTVKIPSGAEAGEYTATLDITYQNMGGSLETNISKVYSRSIKAVIDKTVEDSVIPGDTETAPIAIKVGRLHLDTGKAYKLGTGTWTVSGDKTTYASEVTFYVQTSGDYEFTQK